MASTVTPRAGTLRARITELLQQHPDGLTASEIATKLDADLFVVRPRISEMKKAGALKEAGAARTADGSKRASKALVLL